jgi:hypothetical protein
MSPAVRALPQVTVTVPTPVIIAGTPTLPAHVGRYPFATTAHQGAGHIRAIPDPDPVKDPSIGSWIYPPDTGAGDHQWHAYSLPDPSGYWTTAGPDSYWLGSSADHGPATQWAPVGGGPAWQSFFPYEPAVTNAGHLGPNGASIHQRGVMFNSTFAEHMWCDLGTNYTEPFTFAIVAQLLPYDGAAEHFLLDSGRNPDAVGFPRLADYQTQQQRIIADGLSYRTRLQLGSRDALMSSDLADTSAMIRISHDLTSRPRVYFAVFNGASSMFAAYDHAIRRLKRGRTTVMAPRYLVLGRSHGVIWSQRASHMVVFEIRLWHRALTVADFNAQYAQLAGAWKFSQYTY